MKNFCIVFFLLFGTLGFVFGKHIIGGEIYYTCKGIDTRRNEVTLEFTMKIYRDCGSDGADFDDRAQIGIYTKSSNQSFVFRILEEWKLSSRRFLEASNPCVITPSNICVEEGVYIRTLTFPILNESYFLAYQRCCRNESITNIVDPSSFGAAYTIEITPESLKSCNNSPRFKNFPPILICNNKEIDFDHSAEDLEKDSLVYEFCTPFHAGGQRGSGTLPGDPKACDGVTPDPSVCIPPFNTVIFKAPFYSVLAPMGGNPLVTINPSTGLISGVPTNQGQYVVGVCLKEFRNGKLLSVSQRDFQFNVIECRKNISAGIRSDSVQANDQFIVNSCGDKTVNLINTSTLESNIKNYYWEFNINGTLQTFTTKNISLNLPDLGTYTGLLYLNKGDVDCSDSASILIRVSPGIDAQYAYSYDTCKAGPVQFRDMSSAPKSTITQWKYQYEAGASSGLSNNSYEFKTPGKKRVQLFIKDNNGCTDTVTHIIDYYPVPAVIVLEPNTFAGCQPLDVVFKNLSYPIDTTYQILWDFGDGETASSISPKHSYTKEGIFSVNLQITSPIGCKTQINYPSWISVSKSPVANFSYDPKELSNFQNTIQITDLSIDAEQLKYLINNKLILKDRNTTYTFRDTGLQTITQIVSRLNGCSDTLVQYLDIEPKVTYFMPNAFTPNGEGNNEYFGGVGISTWMRDFHFTIWDRWGSKIFESSDPTVHWNGRFENHGESLPPGVYVYKVEYVNPRGKKIELKGFSNLIR